MSVRSLVSIPVALLAIAGGCALKSNVNPARFPHPVTAKVPVVDDYHGTKVEDPYRWLEDDQSGPTHDWVAAQNAVTSAYLGSIPQRDAILGRLRRLMDFERFGTPVRAGDRWFYPRNDGLQNQDVWYTAATPDAVPTVLLDPNTLSADGTASATGPYVSDDGRLAAYQVSAGGSDWKELRVREVATGRDLPDRLEWVKFSGVAWRKDGSGFYYSRYPAPSGAERLTRVNEFHRLHFHRLGTPQSEDPVVMERKDRPRWGFSGTVTEDGRYLVVTSTDGTDPRNRIYYQDLQEGGPVRDLLVDFDAHYGFLGNDGPVFWFQTDLAAPRGRVVAIDLRKPSRADWRELVPQADATLAWASVVGDRFVLGYLQDAHSRVRVHRLDGTHERDVDLPGIGTAGGFAGRRSDREAFYSFTGYTTPARVYRHDFTTGRSTLWRAPRTAFEPDRFETRQVWVTSRDGTRLPMFVSHRKGLSLDGKNPVLLYGYGGFNISLTPVFSVSTLAWMEMGGVYAVPNLRGGGEYGEEWHQAGTKLRKQNVFDDFIAAAEWLVANRYTQPRLLAIEGRSNGGLLVGACMAQRPDLFGACLPGVGVMDMLRFDRFTIGRAWRSDFGTSENPDEFRALFAYSPFHNLRPGTRYPATLVTTGDHDDRVVPAHSYKFMARLQECQAGPAPVLIRIETKAGHGAGKPTSMLLAERADQLAFLVRQFGMAGPAATPEGAGR